MSQTCKVFSLLESNTCLLAITFNIIYKMQREEFNPDIEIKFQQLLRHMTEKNSTIQQFLRILKEICDAQIFYSRSLDKFANNISKLMVGKDPLKEVFIIFQRAISAKSEQSMQLAKSIKDDMIPFIEKDSIDLKQQNELRGRQRIVKQVRSKMQRKLRNLQMSQNNYRRAYQTLKRYTHADTRAEIQEKERVQKQFSQRETILIDAINSYNNTIEDYLLNYTSICDKLSDIETKRKTNLRDAINKFMIFEISCIKNIEYNIPRYMKNLEKMNDRLIIQDKIGNNLAENNEHMFSLAKISIGNYIANINDREKIDIPNSHKKILDIKKNTGQLISNTRYHQLVAQLYKILDQAMINADFRVLKEVVYFAKSVWTNIQKLPENGNEKSIPSENAAINAQPLSNSNKKLGKSVPLILLDAIMCHKIFKSQQFWQKYEQKLFDIIYRESKTPAIDAQSKQIQVSLNFLAADLDFLKIVAYHPLPYSTLSKFKIINDNETMASPVNDQNLKEKEFEEYVKKNQIYFE